MQASPASNEVRLPAAVVRQSQRVAAKLDAQRAAQQPPAVAATETPPAPPSVEAAPPADPPRVETPADPRHNDPLYWQHRLRALDGVLKQERRAHAVELDARDQQINELQAKVAELEARPTPSSSEVDAGEFFTPEQIERIGEDEATSIAKAAKKAAQDAADAAAAKVEALLKPERERRQRDHARGIEQAKRDYKLAILEEIPDFDEIDEAEDWLTFLGSDDAASGLTNQEILHRHIVALDAPKTIAFVKRFLKLREPPPPPLAPHSSTKRGDDEPTPPNPKALRAPTNTEVKDFYKRAALGKVSPQERAEFEARQKLRVATR